MSEGTDRRARKKAATRALVLSTAQRLFDERGFDAVTVADVAATADVAVQTVFNHFPTKEELFFADRTPWVDAPAEAVRLRDPAVSPTDALRRAMVASVGAYLEGLADPGHRAMVAAVSATPALRTRERELGELSRRRLQAALAEAWADLLDRDPDELRRAAALVAATWIATVRTVADEFREPIPAAEQVPDRAREAVELTDRVLSALQSTLDGVGTLARR
ncbi:TetR/AcrR family transcriptional regulator [Blastococcus sp. SYSU D00695]